MVPGWFFRTKCSEGVSTARYYKSDPPVLTYSCCTAYWNHNGAGSPAKNKAVFLPSRPHWIHRFLPAFKSYRHMRDMLEALLFHQIQRLPAPAPGCTVQKVYTIPVKRFDLRFKILKKKINNHGSWNDPLTYLLRRS